MGSIALKRKRHYYQRRKRKQVWSHARRQSGDHCRPLPFVRLTGTQCKRPDDAG